MRVISRLLTLTLIGFLCVLFNAHADDIVPGDVKGWRNTHWGMSPIEIKNILGNKWNITGDQVLKIKDYDILDFKSEVRLDFRKNNQLSRVVVFIQEKGEHISVDDAHSALHKIRESLTSQYGEGQIIRDIKEGAYSRPGFKQSGQEQFEMQWTFPSSIIGLRYTFAGALSIGDIVQKKHLTIFIKYTENTASK